MMPAKLSSKSFPAPMTVYLLYFGAVFLAFPLKGSLVGNSDVIVHTAYFYEHLFRLIERLGMGGYGHAYYPGPGIYPYMESYAGPSLIFWVFKGLGAPDTWAVYLLYTVLFSLNSYSVYALSLRWSGDRRAAFVAGLFFGASCLMFSTLEFLNGVVFFCIPFALLAARDFTDSGKTGDFIRLTVWLALQSFFSAYFFLMGTAVVTGWLLIRWKRLPWRKWPVLLAASVPSLVMVLPLLIKVAGPAIDPAANPLLTLDDPYYRFSVHLRGFVTSLPNNLLYGRWETGVQEAVKTSYRVNTGILSALLALAGIFVLGRRYGFFLGVFIVALLISFGPHTYIGDRQIGLPLRWLYEVPFFRTFFRMPGRAYILCTWIIALLAAEGWKFVDRQLGHKHSTVWMWIAVTVFSFENLAIPPYVSDHRNLFDVPAAYASIPDPGPHQVIADLPSSLFTETGYKNGITEFTREYRYQLWQTRHRMNIINGSASFYPPYRLTNDQRMRHLDRPGQLDSLISENGLTYLVFHKDLILREEEAGFIGILRESDYLRAAYEDDRCVLFKVVSYPDPASGID